MDSAGWNDVEVFYLIIFYCIFFIIVGEAWILEQREHCGEDLDSA